MTDTPDKAAADLKAKEDALAAERKDLDAERAAFAEAKRRDHVEAVLDELVKGGKVLPAEKPGLAAFMTALDDKDTVQFGEGDANKKTPAAFMTGFLKALPVRVDFKERSAEDGRGAPDPSDPAAIAALAIAFQEENRAKGIAVSVDAAVRHVLKQP